MSRPLRLLSLIHAAPHFVLSLRVRLWEGVLHQLRNGLRSSASLSAARLIGAGAGFLTQVILARLLSPHDLGLFFASMSLAVVLSLFASAGFPGITQRFFARYRSKNRFDLLAAFVRKMQSDSLRLSLGTAAAMLVLSALWPAPIHDRLTFAVAAFSMLALTAISVQIALASAERRFDIALLPEIAVRPFAFLTLVALIWWLGIPILGAVIAALYAGVTVSVAAIQFVLVTRLLPAQTAPVSATRLHRRWRNEALPLTVVALFTNLFADGVILCSALFLEPRDMAVFGVAVKLAMLIGFFTQVFQQMALPDLAAARERHDPTLIRDALRQATRAPTLLTACATLVVLIWGDNIMGIFGPEFVRGRWCLVVLVAAQLVRSAAGPNVLVLTLLGAQLSNLSICLCCAAVLLLSDAILIPTYGLVGAATATVLCYALWVGSAAVVLWRTAGVRTDLLVLIHQPVLSRTHSAP